MKKEFLLPGLLLLCSAFVLPACSDDDESEFVGNWKDIGSFEGVQRSNAVTFTIGSNVYVSSGVDKKLEYLNDLWVMDPGTLAWTQKASIGVVDGEQALPRGYAVGFAVGNAGYVGLGWTASSEGRSRYLRDFWKFDPASNSWTKMSDFGGSGRQSAVAFVVNDRAYVGTGDDGNHLKDFWRYEAASDSWTQITSIGGSKRLGASAFVVGNNAYVVCGENNGTAVNDFWMFNGADESWVEKRRIANVSTDAYDDEYNVARAYAASFVLDGKAYVTCGESGGSMRNDTWEYDPAADLWEEKTPFERTARSGAIGFSVSGRAFVATGRSSSNYFDDMHEFFPNAEYEQYD